MNGITKKRVAGLVQGALIDFAAQDVVSKIAGVFPAPARVFLIGGFIRNAVLGSISHAYSTPRDLDFVVFGLESELVEKHLMTLGQLQPTSLGGAKVRLGDWSVDVWTPAQQIAIAGGEPHECNPQQLLSYSTLTVDAVLFDCVREDIYERGFLRAIDERTIDLGSSSKWISKWAPFHLAHMASVWSSTQFTLSARALNRIAEHNSPQVRARAIKYLKEHKKIKNAFALIEHLTFIAQENPVEQTVP